MTTSLAAPGDERPTLGLVAIFAGGKALAVLGGVVTSIMMGRLFGTEGLGRWTLVLAAGTLLHTALVNWTHLPTARFGREEWVRTRTLRQTLAARFPVLAICVLLSSLALWLQPGNWMATWFQLSVADRWLVALCAASAWIAAEAQATLQATEGFRLQATLAPLVVGVPIVILSLLAFSGGVSLEVAVIALTVVPMAGWGSAWASRLEIGARPQRAVITAHLTYAWPMIPGFAIGYFSTWVAHLLLSRMTTLSDVGLFGLAYQFLAAAITVNGLLPTFLLPWLIRRESEASDATRDYVQALAPTLFTLWMLGTLWVVAALPVLLTMFAGPELSPSTTLLVLLLAALPTAAVTSFYTVLFDVQRRLGWLVIYMIPPTLANVLVCLVAMPTHGAAAAAAGTVASFVVSQALYVWDQHRQLAVPAGSIWLLMVTGIALGISQVFVAPTVVPRLIWAAAATIALVLVARVAGTVSSAVVQRLCGARVRWLTPVVARVFPAKD